MSGGGFLSAAWYRVASLRPRLRPHVHVRRRRFGGQPWYVIEDRLTGRVHRFTTAAWALIGRFDGKHSIGEIWDGLAERDPAGVPPQPEVIQLLAQLHGADLLQADVSPDVAELLMRQTRQRWRRLLGQYGSPLSIKLPLLNPDAFLERAQPLVRSVLGGKGWLAWLTVVLSGAALAMYQATDLAGAVQDRLRAAENLATGMLVFALLKALHETAHGLVARTYGVAVREAGVMLLVFFPAPYVEVSGAAALPNRWQRAAIGAAGMAAELFVAALAMVAWSLLEPGLPRAIALDVVLVAGVSTVVFNGNPLMRLDGYYILSDLIDVPNLQQRAQRYWAGLVERYGFGLEARPEVTTRTERLWFLVYTPAAFCYRLLVLTGIALALGNSFFIIGALLAAWAVAMGLGWPVIRGVWFVLASPRLAGRRQRAVLVAGGTAALALGLILLLPIPVTTVADGVVWLSEEAQQRVGTGGFVERLEVAHGSAVATGAPLLQLREPVLETEVKVGEAKVDELLARIANERQENPAEAAALERELAQQRAALIRDRERVDRLLLRATAAGKFYPLRPENLPGRFMREGDLVGYVAGPGASVGRVVVHQDDVALVQPRLRRVELLVADGSGRIVATRLLRAVPTASDSLPSPALGTRAGGRFVTDPADREGTRTLDRLFQFDLEMPAALRQVPFGTRLRAKFVHHAEPLAQVLARRLRQLFLSRFGV